MNKRSRKSQKTQSTRLGEEPGSNRKLSELVIVSSLDTMDDAKDCQTLLENNDIPALVKRHQDELTGVKRFAVLVPDEMADEAHVIIESQDSFDDFYDSEIDDISEDDLEGDIFED